MTLNELLHYLASSLPYPVLDGDVAATLEKARSGAHREPLMGEIIANLLAAAGESADAAVERAAMVSTLGPLRLRYMKDDAPVEGFRMVERSILAIDSAFNEEALRQKQRT